MYSVSNGHVKLGAGPRPIHYVDIPLNLRHVKPTLENMLTYNLISKRHHDFLSRRYHKVCYVGMIFAVESGDYLDQYTIWADLSLRDETMYALLTV